MNGKRKGTCFVLLVVMCAALVPWAPAAQQAAVAIPDTLPGRKLSGWLEALNSGKRERMLAFIAANYAQSALGRRSAEARADFLTDLFQDTGGYEVRKVGEGGEHTLAVLAQDRKVGDWTSLRIDLEPQPPNGILGILIQSEQPPSIGRKLTDEQLAAALRDYVDRLAAADQFSGAVLVARNGKPVFRGAWGQASRAWNEPNRVDTKFNLGSMNKMVTAVALAQLAQQGKLSFDDKVGKFLPDYPNADVREKVTIHHLLTHTGGIPDYFNEKYMRGAKERFRTVQDFLDLFSSEPLRFEPGSQWRYSNGGFMLAGAIVEKASGQNYFDYVREHIYQPAGMANTDAYEMDRDTPNLAIGYTRQCPGGRRSPEDRCNNLYLHVVKGGPAGGGFSTVEDLVKFADALRGHKLLDAKHTDLVTTGKVSPNPEDPERYAYGFQDENIDGHRIVGHGGGFNGINGKLDIYLDGSGYSVAVLSNYDPPAAQRVADRVRTLLLQP